MPLRGEWRLAREGFTINTFIHTFSKTFLNPWQTLPLYLLCLYTAKGQEIALSRPKIVKFLRDLVILGFLRRTSQFLSKGVLNNWVSDVYDWQREIVVVTGGSDGIGAKVVLLLAEMGVKVAVIDVQPLQYAAPANVHYFHCDLASSTSISQTATHIRQTLGHPTILINNAGIGRNKAILDTTEQDLDMTFAINTKALHLLARQFLPYMVQTNHGTVVTVASVGAYLAGVRMSAYNGSKAAALTFHEALQMELKLVYKAPKVRTICVCPNHVKTPLFKGFDVGDDFFSYSLEPETVAEEIVKAVLRGRSDHIVLPTSANLFRNVRNWPLWMAELLRRKTDRSTRMWKGREVAQPSERLAGTATELGLSEEGPAVGGGEKVLTGVHDSDELLQL